MGFLRQPNLRNLKVVAFKGSADAITNLLGGHVDVVTTAAGNVINVFWTDTYHDSAAAVRQ